MPEFPEQTMGSFTIISDDLMLYAASDMKMYGEYLVILAQHNDRFLHIYDRRTGDRIARGLHHGRGPGEIMQVFFGFSLDSRNGDLFVFDPNAGKDVLLNVDSMVRGKHYVVESDRFDNNGVIAYHIVYPLPDESFITRLLRHERYRMIRDGEEIASYPTFPIEDRVLARLMYNHDVVSLSPDGKRMAVGTGFGAILETFDLRDGIRNISTSYFIEPKVDIKSDDIFWPTEETINGFGTIYAGNDLVYTTFGGTSEPGFPKKIAIFDWYGNPVRLITTDSNIFRICVDEADGTLYALIIDEHEELILARMDIY